MASRARLFTTALMLALPVSAGIATFPVTAQAATQPVGDATATVETEPVLSSGDAADDPAIWVHPTDPSRSVVIGNDKGGALEVYDLNGTRIQRIAEGFFGNVDVRSGFPTATGSIDLVGVYRQGLRFYRIDPDTRQLTNATDSGTGSISSPIGGEGFCMYHSAVTGVFSAFVINRNGVVAQYVLSDSDGDGLVEGQQVRQWSVGSESEGCVADDELGALYISEEDVAIWRYGAEPDASPANRVAVDTTIANGGHIAPDAEGLTIVNQPNGTGYLVASSQAASNTNNYYTVYERQGSNAFLRTFKVIAGDTTDGCGRTDGVAAYAGDLGPLFPQGLFVCQDNQNTEPGGAGYQNFKLVPLERVVGLSTGEPTDNLSPTTVIDSSCIDLTCTFDATGSSDLDGVISAYAWTFGDGSESVEAQTQHTYSGTGAFTVTLSVTDNEGAAASSSRLVAVVDPANTIGFRGVGEYKGSARYPTATVPSNVQAGDGLVLLVTLNATSTTIDPPSGVTGWSQLTNFVTGSERTLVWQKVAAAADAGTGVRVAFGKYAKTTMQVLAYSGTSAAGPVATWARRSDPALTVSHVTPSVTASQAGAWLISYWADKGSTTTDWQAPSIGEVRSELIGTGTGRITALVADSGSPEPLGTNGELTAVTNAPSRAAMVSLLLAPRAT